MRNRYWRGFTFMLGHTLPLTMISSPKYSGSQYGWLSGLSPTELKWMEPSELNALSVSMSGTSNSPEGSSGAILSFWGSRMMYMPSRPAARLRRVIPRAWS